MAPRGPRPTPRLAALLAVSATLVAGVFFVQSHVLFMHQASSAIVLDSDRHALDRPPTAQLPPNQRSPKELPGEVWAGHPLPSLAAQAAAVRDLLSTDEQKVGGYVGVERLTCTGQLDSCAIRPPAQELEALCGRCLLHQLKLFVGHGNAQKVFVATGE